MVYVGLLLVGGFLGWMFREKSFIQEHPDTAKITASKSIWTCAMDPQIRQLEPGSCPICGMALTMLANDSLQIAMHRVDQTQHGVDFAKVRTSIIKDSTKSTYYVPILGKIASHEQNYRLQPAFFPGRIEAPTHTYCR